MAWPDYNQFLSEVWGWDSENVCALSLLALASNILMGTNPPYAASDFFSTFPQFAGKPVTVTGDIDGTTALVTNVSDTSKLIPGLLVQGNGIPCGAAIETVLPNSFTITQLTTADGTGVSITVLGASALIPSCVLNSIIYLATSSILQVRYQEMWSYAMALYIAHYCTLWLQALAQGAGSTPGQVAAAGVAQGLMISKHVGDVSRSNEPLRSLNDFGTYALTTYGQQLATFAKAVGSGPVWCW